MSGAYVIEIEDQTAGLVIAERRGYRFFASERIFRKLDGRLFQQVRQAHGAAAEIWRQHCARSRRSDDAAQLFDMSARQAEPIRASWGLVHASAA
jgi:hypothetical protein